MDIEDMKKLEAHLNDIYVRQNVCNERQEEVNRMLANDNTRLELITKDVEVIKEGISNFKKMGWSVLGALATQIIIMLINMAR